MKRSPCQRPIWPFGWALLALQLLSLVVGAIGRSIATPDHPVHLDAGFSVTGWLAVLLAFVPDEAGAERFFRPPEV